MGKFCIAIDGPAGAGKSTVARILARRLGYMYVDTGAMYRAVTLEALRQGIDLKDEKALTSLIAFLKLELTTDPGQDTRVFIEGEDVTSEIRSPEVSRHVSCVASLPGVRAKLTRQQREMAKSGKVVMEGRDVGTVIVPDAQAKFFLTASVQERARRRQLELSVQGKNLTLEDLIAQIEERDRLDSKRKVSPLTPAPDAVVIDCSQMSIEEVIEFILGQVRRSN